MANAKGTSFDPTQTQIRTFGLTFVQANLGRGRAATMECVRDAEGAGVGVLLLQEPYVGSKGYLQLSSHRVVQQMQGSAPVRSAVVVLDPTFNIVVNPHHLTTDISTVILTRGSTGICIISVYLDGEKLLEDDIKKLKEIMQMTATRNTILAGDFNAASHWWGCRVEDDRGTDIVDFLSEVGLNVVNQGSAPTYHTYRRGKLCASIVDVTTCSDALVDKVSGWKVVKDDAGLSDHRKIHFHLSNEREGADMPLGSTRCFNTKKADWNVFDRVLHARLMEENLTEEAVRAITSAEELESVVVRFTNVVRETCRAAIPAIVPGGRSRRIAWWTEELNSMKRNVKTLRRRIAGAHPRRKRYVYEEYAAAREAYKLAIEKTITGSWMTFCSQQKAEDIWKSSYRVIKRCMATSSQKECLLESPRDNAILTPAESARLLASTFFPSDDPELDSDQQASARDEAATLRRRTMLALEPNNFLPFSGEEADSVFRGMNPNKAPGADGLTSDICHRVHRVCPLLLTIFNRCLELASFPRIWKEAWIRVIPKPGKENYMNPKAYRPIGLLPVMGKALEKMIFCRLSWDIFRVGGLSQRQYGFVPQKSTEDALYDAIACVRSGLNQKKLVALVSLDIEGAFDGAWWPAIVRELHKKGIDDSIFRIICDYLEDRKVTLGYLGERVTTDTVRGCIQGSIGGPLLWNILLDPLLRRMDSAPAQVQAFADDILVLATANTASDLNEKINSTLEMISVWGRENKMSFAAHKTQAILITRKLKYDAPCFILNGVRLTLSSEIKILGLTIDRTLGFRSHLESVTTRALNLYKMVTRMAKAQWGLNPEILRTIYCTVVEPTILYAAGAWGEVAGREYVKRRLDRVTRDFAIKIAKAHRTVSLVSGALLARVLPLDLRLQENCELYQIKRGKSLSVLPGRRLQPRVHPSQFPHPAKRTRLKFGLVASQEDVPSTGDGRSFYYTDGSKIEGRVGAAVSVWNGEEEVFHTGFRLESQCTVFQAEIVAIYRATELILGGGAPHTS